MPPVRYKHLTRYREIAGTLFDEGFGYALDELGLRRFLRASARIHRRHVGPEDPLEIHVRRALERLGPAFIKMGQLLSTRPDLLPESYLIELRKLQDEVPPAPYEHVAAVITEELGGPPEEVFLAFDPVPIAAASIGQVHAAVLPDGREVAVKVQRPDICDLVETDLDILLTQARFVESQTGWGHHYGVVDYAEEVSYVVRGELDYLAEGRNAERFAENFKHVPDVTFPIIHWDYTTKRVLTMTRFRGIKLDDVTGLDAAGYDRHALARRGVDAYLKMVFVDGFFHADPHPGNIFVLADQRLGFTDFGRVGVITQRIREQFSNLFLALLDRDENTTLDVLRDMGVVPPGVDDPTFRSEISQLFARYYDISLREVRVGELMDQLLHDIRVHDLRVPAEYSLPIATVIVLEGVGSTVYPEFNLVEAMRPFAAQLLQERYSPEAIWGHLSRSVRNATRLAYDLPDSLARVLRRTADGNLKMEVEPTGLDPLMDRLAELVNRIAFAILVSAFVIGFSQLIKSGRLPQWLDWFFGAALLAASGVGVWLFISIFIAMWQARRDRIRRS